MERCNPAVFVALGCGNNSQIPTILMGAGFKPASRKIVTAVSAQTQHAQQASEI